MRLIQALESIVNEKLISFHMPGHKNGRLTALNDDYLKYDITEIPGADHLHDAESCIRETEQAISDFYQSYESHMLVNGSTVGILSMILGCTEPGDKVLVNRNAHKSIYNAIEMNNLIPIYMYPEVDNEFGVPQDFILSEHLKCKDSVADVKICILTYPTYEGLCYSIEDMIEFCHANKIPVLVDEAHGSHLILHKTGPKSALELGADVVVQSFHKTLPAMTQTSCIHFSKNAVLNDFMKDRIRWYLKSLQSSSPSYVLMASIDSMLTIMEKNGSSLAHALENHVQDFYTETSQLKYMRFYHFKQMDITKMLLVIPKAYYCEGVFDGPSISRALRETHRIQCEYETNNTILFMTSIANMKSDFDKLKLALFEIEHAYGQWIAEPSENQGFTLKQTGQIDYNAMYQFLERHKCQQLSVYDAIRQPRECLEIDDAVGKISCEYVTPYPPGIPIIVPGEVISEMVIQLFPKEKTRIEVVKC